MRVSKRRCQRTLDVYTEILERFDGYLSGAPLTEENARTYLRRRALGEIEATTQALEASVLRTLSRWLACEEKTAVWWLKSPKLSQKRIRVIAEEDLSKLIDVVSRGSSDEETLFYLLYGSALRISEALSLEIQNIDFSTGRARVLGKGSKWREIPLVERAAYLLKSRMPEQPNWHSNRIHYSRVRAWMRRWGEESGVNKKYGALHPHLFRHSLASHLLRRGAGLPHIQKLLGHERLNTTQKYTHLELDDLLRIYDRSIPKTLK